MVASACPSTTCWPSLTLTLVSCPPVAKFTFVWRAWIVPLPDTVDCTTPRPAVTVRDRAAGALSGPTTSTATTIAPAQRRVRTTQTHRGVLAARRIRRKSYDAHGRGALEQLKTFLRNVRQLRRRARRLTSENRAGQGRREAGLRTQAADRGRRPAKVCSRQATRASLTWA